MFKFTVPMLTCAVLAGSIGVAAQAQAKTFIYNVTVKTSFGTKFADCFTFEKGVLTVTGLGQFEYTAAPMDPKHFYTAVESVAQAEATGFGIGFAGFKLGTDARGELHAVGADEFHDSYIVKGVIASSCSGDAVSKAGVNYRPVAQ